MSNISYSKLRDWPIVDPYSWYIGLELQQKSSGPIGPEISRINAGVLSELRRAHDQSKLNPELEAATTRAYNRALNILIRSQERFSYGSLPYIVVPGDGGVIVEWADGDNFISITVDHLNKELDAIFYRLGESSDTVSFSYDRMDEYLTALFSREEIAASIPKYKPIVPKASVPSLSNFGEGSSAPSYAHG